MQNILVTGSNGQLGKCLRLILPNAVYTERQDLDVSCETSIASYFQAKKFDAIINLAAYTQVDKAETEKEVAYKINALAPSRLAQHCKRLIHISTDYVFDGKKQSPYTEEDACHPVNYYGESKRQGEINLITAYPSSVVIRTSWLYSAVTKNFVTSMLQFANTKPELRIVNDQTGRPTYAMDLAEVIIKTLNSNIKGIYQYANQGTCTWYELTKEIFRIKSITIPVHPITTADYPTPAKRPAYSVMDTTKIETALELQIPTWQESLRKCLQGL